MTASRSAHPAEPPAAKRLNVFERYLSLWVALCMGVGIFAGKAFPAAVDAFPETRTRDVEHLRIRRNWSALSTCTQPRYRWIR